MEGKAGTDIRSKKGIELNITVLYLDDTLAYSCSASSFTDGAVHINHRNLRLLLAVIVRVVVIRSKATVESGDMGVIG